MEPNAIKRTTAHGRDQAQPSQNRRTFRHKAFTARLFSRESCFLVKLHGQTLPAEHNRKRGAGDTAANNENIGHRSCLRRANSATGSWIFLLGRWVWACLDASESRT